MGGLGAGEEGEAVALWGMGYRAGGAAYGCCSLSAGRERGGVRVDGAGAQATERGWRQAGANEDCKTECGLSAALGDRHA